MCRFYEEEPVSLKGFSLKPKMELSLKVVVRIKSGQTILIIDDEPKIIEVVAIYLDAAGYRVLTAQTGEEALNLLRNHHLDLVILDYMLPDIEGPELCREILKFYNLPILMLSARVAENDITKGFEYGAAEYVTKPVSPKFLVSKVQKLLANNTGEKYNPGVEYNAV